MRKRVSIAILLVAGCGGSITPGQVGIPCDPIVKHDTIQVHDTTLSPVYDTLIIPRDVYYFDMWRDTIYLNADSSVNRVAIDRHDTTPIFKKQEKRST